MENNTLNLSNLSDIERDQILRVLEKNDLLKRQHEAHLEYKKDYCFVLL